MPTLGLNLLHRNRLRLPSDEQPRLMVVIDTEEEFDWSHGFDSQATGVSAMREVGRLQGVFDEFEHRPTYVIDYPVATDPFSIETLGRFRAEGRAQVGTHLHPWVSPPHEEEVCARHSYQGNLPADLERRKMTALTEAIETNFGFRPTVHKAGRYGFGAHTAETLLALGYEVDLSAAPGFDFSGDDGPDYSRLDGHLYTFGENDGLLGIPTTGGFIGPLRGLGPRVFSHQALETSTGWLRAGLLSKPKFLERILLSPEGQTIDELKRLTRSLLRSGVRVLTFSLHSPSAKPGCTPYTHSEDDVQVFLQRCREYFRFFAEEVGGIGTTPAEVRERVRAVATPI